MNAGPPVPVYDPGIHLNFKIRFSKFATSTVQFYLVSDHRVCIDYPFANSTGSAVVAKIADHTGLSGITVPHVKILRLEILRVGSLTSLGRCI